MPDHIAEEFLPQELPSNPMLTVAEWLQSARSAANQPNSNAMTLATCNSKGQPAARIVLCKHFDALLGTIDFFTNYTSRKGNDLRDNANVAVVFHWDHQGRQVRIEGSVVRLDTHASDAYFASRPRASQIGAWASEQSEPIGSRDDMVKQFRDNEARLSSENSIDRPPHWGGYKIWAAACELWVEGAGRVHDRARFERTLSTDNDNIKPGDWRSTRLQP